MHERHVLTVRPRRLAAPARQDTGTEHPRGLEPHIDALATEWARWCETRRFYGPSPKLRSVLGELRTSRSTAPTGPSAFCSRELATFHTAVLAQGECLGRVAFEAHYALRVKPIKKAASLLGVSRSHWYYLVNGFARHAYASYRELLEADPPN